MGARLVVLLLNLKFFGNAGLGMFSWGNIGEPESLKITILGAKQVSRKLGAYQLNVTRGL